MDEQILNYLDMSEEQKEKSLKALKSIGFSPACGKEKTMKKLWINPSLGKCHNSILFLEKNS